MWKSVRPETFFGLFFAFFPVDSNSASNLPFYGTHIEFLQKNFTGYTVLALFAKFKAELGRNAGGGGDQGVTPPPPPPRSL